VRLLLDTHVWIWLRLEPDRLSRSTADALQDADSIALSLVTAWEMANDRRARFSRGLPLPCTETAARFPLLLIRPSHVVHLAGLPWHHRDPFDRMLVAQAQAEGLVIVTADRAIRAYDVAVLPA